MSKLVIGFPRSSVQGPHQEPLQALWPVAFLPPQVRYVPLLLSGEALALRGDIPGVIKSSW